MLARLAPGGWGSSWGRVVDRAMGGQWRQLEASVSHWVRQGLRGGVRPEAQPAGGRVLEEWLQAAEKAATE